MKPHSLFRIYCLFVFIFVLTSNIYSQTPGTQKWSLSLNNEIYSSPAIGSDGTIYVGSDDSTLYAINPNGMQKWAFNTGGKIFSTPAIISDGTIYVGCENGNLYAINPNGTKKWSLSISPNNEIVSSPAIAGDETIYIGSQDNKLYAINPDGTQKWTIATGGAIKSCPAIGSDGTIYVGCDDTKLYAINPDGTQKWAFNTGDGIFSSPAIGFDGTIFVGCEDYNLYAINPDGTKKWSFLLNNEIISSPAIGSDGTIYIGGEDGNLYAINPNGTKKWSLSISPNNEIVSSPAIGSDGTIHIGSFDSKLYAINPNGTQKWAFNTGGVIFSSLSIGSDGTIYVGCDDHYFYAIYSDCGGIANTGWSKFRGDIKNTGNSADIYGLTLNSQLDFNFITSGQYYSKPSSISNYANNNIIINGCTFDNSDFSLGTSLPITVAKSSSAQLTVKIHPASSKIYKSKCTITYTLNSQTKTVSNNIIAGIFIDDNSELAYSAHQALNAYNSCYTVDPTSIATTNNLGVLYRLLGEYSLAGQYLIQALSSAINASYGYSGIKMNIGVVKSDEDSLRAASTYYFLSQTDIAKNADSSSLAPQIYYNQAWEYYKSDSLTQALSKINSTILHRKTDDYLKAKAYVLRGAIYFINNNTTSSKNDLLAAIKLDPNGPIGRLANDNLSLITDVKTATLLPTEFLLEQNYPNPFNPVTTIKYQIPERSNVKLLIYDIMGREIRTLVNENKDIGYYSINWNGKDNSSQTVSSGVYLLKINAGNFTKVKKMVLLR